MPHSHHNRTPSRVVTNKNVDWVGAPGAWLIYILIVVISWLLVLNFAPMSMSWTIVHLGHTVFTFYAFHWVKGTPGLDESGQYNQETFWEQLDEGVQGTMNRKFLAVVPAVLFALATHTAEYQSQPLILNIVAVMVALVPKLPGMTGVRLFGINKY